MWEQLDEMLRDADFPAGGGVGEIGEPSGDELRAANLLERSVEPIAYSAQSQAAYATETLRHASVLDEEGTAGHRHQADAALKAGRFLREIAVSELDSTARQLERLIEMSRQTNEDKRDLRKNPDYVPDDPRPISGEAESEAERCDICELEEAVAHWEAMRDGVDALVARVRELNPRAAIAFDREQRSGSVT